MPVGAGLQDRVHRLRVIEEEQRLFRPMIYWYLTFRCNLACAHCSVHSSPWVDTSEDLTTDECLRVVEQMFELNVRIALLTGGEFLIRPDSLQILRALADKGIEAGVESNGIHFPPGFIELARSMQAKNLLSMTISLDGGTAETHERLRGPRSFERTAANLRLLKENGIKFSIQCVLNNENLGTIPNLYSFARELYPECMSVQWAMLNPVGRGVGLVQELGLRPESIPVIFETIKAAEPGFPGTTYIKVPPAVVPPKYLSMILKKNKIRTFTTCEFPLLGVLPNGDVSICALSRDNQDLHFGNVREEGFRLKSVWEKTRMDLLRSRYVVAEDLAGICGDCVWKYQCKGSCRAWAYEEGGSFDAPFPICEALDDAGAFPNLYRLSSQNAAAAAAFQRMSVGCGCSH
ncbi:MAG TPA: radical SAM protein [Thermoanaerobaculia bacterium]|nr:radical SAM protein [Thermoanaerobaculia bacterium]